MTTYAIGADVSTHAVHLALVGADAVVGHRIADLTGPVPVQLQAIRDALRDVQYRFYQLERNPSEPWALWLEAPWARADKGIATALALHRVAAFVEAMGWLAGLQVRRVAIPTWRSQIFGRQPRSAAAKAMSIAYVKAVFGIETRDANLADAICIGAWGQRQARVAELVG